MIPNINQKEKKLEVLMGRAGHELSSYGTIARAGNEEDGGEERGKSDSSSPQSHLGNECSRRQVSRQRLGQSKSQIYLREN